MISTSGWYSSSSSAWMYRLSGDAADSAVGDEVLGIPLGEFAAGVEEKDFPAKFFVHLLRVGLLGLKNVN